MPNFTLKDYLREVEEKFDEIIPTWEDYSLPIDVCSAEEAKDFISQSIAKAATESLREARPERYNDIVYGIQGKWKEGTKERGHNDCIEIFDTRVKKILGQ